MDCPTERAHAVLAALLKTGALRYNVSKVLSLISCLLLRNISFMVIFSDNFAWVNVASGLTCNEF